MPHRPGWPPSPGPGRRRWRAAALLLACLALTGTGLGLLVHGLQRRPPPAPASAGLLSQTVEDRPTGSPEPAASSARESAPASTPSPAAALVTEAAASVPLRITIPSIGVRAPVGTVGVDPHGAIGVPRDVATAAWYRYSPSPGTLGPSVIVGHVDSVSDGPGVFYALGRLQPGQPVLVDRADGSTARFTVTRVLEVPKRAFPTALVYGDTTRSELRLITCGGHFDPSSGHYLDNVVAFAVLDSGPATP